MPGVGLRNILFVCTVNNTVYAFDADSANIPNAYWQHTYTPANSRPAFSSDYSEGCKNDYNNFPGNLAIVGTPVIDTTTEAMYFVSVTLDTLTHTFFHTLHAISILDGSEKPGSPVVVSAEVNGNGSGNVAGVVSFTPHHANQRPGLLLHGNNVIIAWGSHCDWSPYHGWMMAYDKSSLQQMAVFNSTKDGDGGGFWMSGNGISLDEDGYIYAGTGNGSVGVTGDPTNMSNRAGSAFKIQLTGSGFVVSDYFTPKNFAEMNDNGDDFAPANLMLVPGTNLIITGSKDGSVYVLDKNNLGQFHADSNYVHQSTNIGIKAKQHATYSFYTGENKEYAYVWSEWDLLKSIPFNRAQNKFLLDSMTNAKILTPTGNSGGMLALSSNGSNDATAIVWASHTKNNAINTVLRQGILQAFDATDVTKEIWNSDINPADSLGITSKFLPATVINGKVYMGGHSNRINVYGLTGGAPEACAYVNVAKNKTAYASSTNGGDNPVKALDGKKSTRWTSNLGNDEYIYVDLGAEYDICKVVLKWKYAAKKFNLQFSNDGTHWTDIIFINSNDNIENVFLTGSSARYVRMFGKKRGRSLYGYALNEFEVYGKPALDSSPMFSMINR